MKKAHITLLGLGLEPPTPALLNHPALRTADCILASPATLASLASFAPLTATRGAPARNAQHIPIKAPTASLLDTTEVLVRQGKKITVLTSGDPLFYSIGVSFAARFSHEQLTVIPALSSMQAAAAAFALPWDTLTTVSIHGRESLLPLAHAVLRRVPVCLLTDAVNTPDRAAAFLLSRGISHYAVKVASCLGLPDASFWTGSLEAATAMRFATPNVAFFIPDQTLAQPLPLVPGLPEHAFAREASLITKWPVRAAILAALQIAPEHTVWDLGSGSGSVAIDAAALAHRGEVVAIERAASRVALIAENRRRFGVATLSIHQAKMPDCLAPEFVAGHTPFPEQNTPAPPLHLPVPDRIFIGGGLGTDPTTARRIIQRAWDALAPTGRLVVACVLLRSFSLAREEMNSRDPHAEVTLLHAAASMPLGSDVHLQAMNPVFCIAAQKKAMGERTTGE